MNAAMTSRFHSDTSAASRQRSVRRRSMSSSSRSMRVGAFAISKIVGPPSDDMAPIRYGRPMGAIRVGPARCPSRESPENAIELLVARGYSAGDLAREQGIALSVHAPLFAFPGHPDGKKSKMALGALDRTAGIAAAAGAEVIVIHPGFWLGRTPEQTIDDVVASLGTLREKLESKDRAVPFGVEVMGRVSELGSIDHVLEIASRVDWVRPVIDFAHMHATSDGAFTDVDGFAAVLEGADDVLGTGAPFH